MVDYAKALWIPNSNSFPNRYGHVPTYVILHGTAGGSSAQAIANFFQSTQGTANPVSAHYVIGQDGTVIQCNLEHDGAWGNGIIRSSATAIPDPWWSSDLNPNLITISIEHVKPSQDNSDALTTAQKHASFSLIVDICNRWHIPKRKADETGGITGHFSMDPVSRSECPGNYPWDELWQYLSGAKMIDINNPAVANYFQLIGPTSWKCKKNNVTLRDGILKYYQNVGGMGLCGLTLLGLPVKDEISDHPGTAWQEFERGIIVYDPQHQLDSPPGSADCYLKHVENYYSMPDQIATLQKTVQADTFQINSLKAQLDEAQKKVESLSKQVAITPNTAVLNKLLSELQNVEADIKTLLSA